MVFAKNSFQLVILALLVIFLFNSADSRSKAFTSAFCSVSDPDLTVVFLNEPPYVIAKSTKYGNGLIYDFVRAGLARCFHQYNCNAKNVFWKGVSSQDELSSHILNGTAEIGIAIATSVLSTLTEELEGLDDRVTLIKVLTSPGLAMVIDYNVCKKKIESNTTKTIMSAWPIGAVMLLLAGISGIFIWALVSGPWSGGDTGKVGKWQIQGRGPKGLGSLPYLIKNFSLSHFYRPPPPPPPPPPYG